MRSFPLGRPGHAGDVRLYPPPSRLRHHGGSKEATITRCAHLHTSGGRDAGPLNSSGGKRLLEIVAVLARHGLAAVVGHLTHRDRAAPGLTGRRLGGHRRTPAEHLRLALEDLGTTFVKLG